VMQIKCFIVAPRTKGLCLIYPFKQSTEARNKTYHINDCLQFLLATLSSVLCEPFQVEIPYISVSCHDISSSPLQVDHQQAKKSKMSWTLKTKYGIKCPEV
jgi:hypothetical protein